MTGRHDWDVAESAVGVYDDLLADLMSRNRTTEEDILADRIIHKTGELFRYEELMHAAGAVATSDRLEHRRIASELSVEIMGGVNQSIFDSLVSELLDGARTSGLPYVQELIELVHERPHSGEECFELLDATIDTIRGDLFDLYPELKGLLERPIDGEITTQEAKPIFEQLLQLGNIGDEWTVEFDDGKSVRTDSKSYRVVIGKNRKSFESWREAVAVGFHEAIVHAGRSSGPMYPGGLDIEEGLATRLQQVLSGKNAHLASSIIYLLDYKLGQTTAAVTVIISKRLKSYGVARHFLWSKRVRRLIWCKHGQMRSGKFIERGAAARLTREIVPISSVVKKPRYG